MIYNIDTLTQYCTTNDIILLEDYSGKHITCKTKIIGKCKECDNSFIKACRYLISGGGGYCKKCSSNIAQKKREQTHLDKYGVENPMQCEEIRSKMKETNFEKRGVEYPLQHDESKKKYKQTNMKRHGVENPSQCEAFKIKKKKTNFERRGVEHPLQCDESKMKFKRTSFERHGTAHPMQSDEVKSKIKQAYIKKHGVAHPMQNGLIASEQQKRCYLSKQYRLQSGKIIHIQGYEHFALNELICDDTITEDDIVTVRSDVPEIWYTDSLDRKHRHYVDIFIKSQNKCIEVKSRWTYENKHNHADLKQAAAKMLGYLYEIWVYDAKGRRIESHV